MIKRTRKERNTNRRYDVMLLRFPLFLCCCVCVCFFSFLCPLLVYYLLELALLLCFLAVVHISPLFISSFSFCFFFLSSLFLPCSLSIYNIYINIFYSISLSLNDSQSISTTQEPIDFIAREAGIKLLRVGEIQVLHHLYEILLGLACEAHIEFLLLANRRVQPPLVVMAWVDDSFER